jgi:hypothetical protein
MGSRLFCDPLPIRQRFITDIGVDFAEKREIRFCPTIEAFQEA